MELRERIAAAAFEGFECNGHDWEWLTTRPESESWEGWPQSEIDDWLRVADRIIENLGLTEDRTTLRFRNGPVHRQRYTTSWENA